MFTLVIHLDQQTTKNRFNAGQNIAKTTKLVVVVFLIVQFSL